MKKIIDCDMAICDLSSKNANVFYELGLRQAFNKKTILITDGREKAPFDIAGFRYVTYSPSLRVDSVGIEKNAITEMLIETENAPEDDVNSIVKLLKINPAHIDKIDLSKSESIIFNIVSKLQSQIERLSSIDYRNGVTPHNEYTLTGNARSKGIQLKKPTIPLKVLMSGNMDAALKGVYKLNDTYLGTIAEINGDDVLFFDGTKTRQYNVDDPIFNSILTTSKS